MPSEMKKPTILKDFKDLGNKIDKTSLLSVDTGNEKDKNEKPESLNGHLEDMLLEIANGENKESKENKKIDEKTAISKFLWKKLEPAIKERFGEEVYFKRFITDEIINRFVKELGGFFYVNEEGFIKSKNASKNGLLDFRMKVGKFARNFLKDIDESKTSKKKTEEVESEVEIKNKKPKSDEKAELKTKQERGKVALKVAMEPVKDNLYDEAEKNKGKFSPEQIGKMLDEMDGMEEEFSDDSRKTDQENEAKTKQEFTNEEKEILEIYLEDTKKMVSFVSNLDYEGEYGYRKERIPILREIELERFWDKFEREISDEGEFAGEKLKKAMEYWKKMFVEK